LRTSRYLKDPAQHDLNAKKIRHIEMYL